MPAHQLSLAIILDSSQEKPLPCWPDRAKATALLSKFHVTQCPELCRNLAEKEAAACKQGTAFKPETAMSRRAEQLSMCEWLIP